MYNQQEISNSEKINERQEAYRLAIQAVLSCEKIGNMAGIIAAQYIADVAIREQEAYGFVFVDKKQHQLYTQINNK